MLLDDMRFLTKPGSMVATFTIIYICVHPMGLDSSQKSGNVLLELG